MLYKSVYINLYKLGIFDFGHIFELFYYMQKLY